MKEAEIEKKVCQYAKLLGWWPLKLRVIGVAGVPDRMFLAPGGRVFFIEFKAPGKKTRALQNVIIKKLIEMGFHVFIVDNITQGTRLVEAVTTQLSEPDGAVDLLS